ncbi:MAG: type II 3-dehydroquinate dehydratase [Clostridia bacterium]|nr:type II 3-dehydroquinate dehydratase [Clostridia bacterium]
MKKILVLNGPNLNMLGIREPAIYGSQNYNALVEYITDIGKALELDVTVAQSNYEGEIVTLIQKALGEYQGIVINAGAYTHTSVAILDALKAVAIPTVEVHLSDINARDEFRKFSYISLYAEKVIVGKGFLGYKEALEYLGEK